MIKKFYHIIDIKMILLLVVMLVISPTLGGKNTYTICLIYSHYLTVYLNNVYLLMIYQYSSRLNQLALPIMTRIGEKHFYMITYFSLMTIGIFYNTVIYISYYFFFGSIPSNLFDITIIFMILNILMNCFESTIIYMQIGQKKNFLYLALPIMMNFLFHVLFTKTF